MPEDRPGNLLALAVLLLLGERPMHPYEIGFVMRSRALDRSIKLNRGSLYTVVEALQRGGLVAPQETYREGRRPERTVYALTDAGRRKAGGWLRELLRRPQKEYASFAAALAFAAGVPVAELIALLEHRLERLEEEIDEDRYAQEALVASVGLPRFYLLENEYELAVREAERDFVRRLVGELRDGSLVPPTPGQPPEE
jgi:DNA-binding PadR family transcriptional regulator